MLNLLVILAKTEYIMLVMRALIVTHKYFRNFPLVIARLPLLSLDLSVLFYFEWCGNMNVPNQRLDFFSVRKKIN
jgi:hypothetical protein